MIRGNFIVFEGIDGSGTTTQSRLLGKAFEKLGLPVNVTQQPSVGPVGSIIRQALSGRLVIKTGNLGFSSPGWKTLALMFAADRADHIESHVEPNLSDGVNVICDRYTYSSVIYQGVSSGKDDIFKWILDINKFAMKPDLVIYLKVNSKTALERRKKRNSREEIFDDPEFQQKLISAYDRLTDIIPNINIVEVDANGPEDEIAAICWNYVEHLREKGSSF